MSPQVSVVIPVFNRPGAVRRAIESVLAQTRQDFEIIVVDDASTDGTPAAVTAIGDPRVRVVRHERNLGGSAARNTGIRSGSAPFVAFLDSDDEWMPDKLARQLEVFERSASTLALVYTGCVRVFANGDVIRFIPRHDPNLTRSLLTENVIGETSLGMVRRSALEAIGGFDENLPSCQDLDLWLRLSERFGVGFIPEALVRVSKGDDRDRISASVARTVWGRELYCHKHRAEMTRQGVLYLHLRETGWWQQRRVRDVRLARRFYRESIKANPIAPLTYVMLIAAYVPLSLMDAMARCKHAVTALSGRTPASPASVAASPSKNSTS
jgi:glycosyltransferase involved in cell wall biosynthesis